MPDIAVVGDSLQDQLLSGSLVVPKMVGSITVLVEGAPFNIREGSIGKELVLGIHDENGLFDSKLFSSASLVIRKAIDEPYNAVSFPLIVDTNTSDPTKFNLRRVWEAGDLQLLTPGRYEAEVDVILGGKLITAPDATNFEFNIVESLNG